MTTKIDNTNYELWLLRYAEGDLGADERAAVEAWLAGHPEAAAELALYREAPRLERDQSVRYVATPLQPAAPRSLWPLLARWSAAAAVIAALMLPALRMGGLATLPPQEEAPQMIAEATLPAAAKEQAKTIATKKNPEKLKRLEKLERLERLEKLEKLERLEKPEAPLTKDSLSPVPSPTAPLPSTNLIALEEEAAPIHSQSLIAQEPDDWGDRLLALNSATHESLSHTTGGRLVSRLLPGNDQLTEHLVDPLREGMNNIRNKRK